MNDIHLSVSLQLEGKEASAALTKALEGNQAVALQGSRQEHELQMQRLQMQMKQMELTVTLLERLIGVAETLGQTVLEAKLQRKTLRAVQ